MVKGKLTAKKLKEIKNSLNNKIPNKVIFILPMYMNDVNNPNYVWAKTLVGSGKFIFNRKI